MVKKIIQFLDGSFSRKFGNPVVSSGDWEKMYNQYQIPIIRKTGLPFGAADEAALTLGPAAASCAVDSPSFPSAMLWARR